MLSPRSLVGVLAVVVAIAAPIVSLYRAGWFQAKGSKERLLLEERAAAQSIYAKARMRPLIEFRAEHELAEHLARAPREGAAELSEGQWSALFAEAGAFFFHRWVQDEPAQYSAWRLARGYSRVPREEMVRVAGIAMSYALAESGERPSQPPEAGVLGHLDDAQLFEYFWRRSGGGEGGAGVPLAIADQDDWLMCVTSRVPLRRNARPFGVGAHGIHLWYGSAATGARSWWAPPRQERQLVDASGRILLAEIGVLVEFQDSSRAPMMTVWAWDADANKWVLMNLSVQNPVRSPPLIEY